VRQRAPIVVGNFGSSNWVRGGNGTEDSNQRSTNEKKKTKAGCKKLMVTGGKTKHLTPGSKGVGGLLAAI